MKKREIKHSQKQITSSGQETDKKVNKNLFTLFVGDDTGLLKQVSLQFRVKDEEIFEKKEEKKSREEPESSGEEDQDKDDSDGDQKQDEKAKDEEAPISFENGKTVVARAKLTAKYGQQIKDQGLILGQIVPVKGNIGEEI